MLMELVPLCTVQLGLEPPLNVGEGPAGHRMVVEISTMELTGPRLNASLKGRTAADWFSMIGSVASIDVRAMLETRDGALLYVQYRGRTDISGGIGSAPVYTTVNFETSHPAYQWLNTTHVVGKGDMANLRYQWFELR